MMLADPPTLTEYLLRLQSAGRVSFDRTEAIGALGTSGSAFLKAAERLQKRRHLLSPRQGFYVIVPPQYLSWGAPPPPWYIDQLMQHEGRPYYVGLLKAAELHGATHHAVMEFQVVTDKQIGRIRVGRSIIAFYYRKNLASVLSSVTNHKTDTGSMKLSSPELTAFDLLRYSRALGGIDTVATVLTDLKDDLDGTKLAALADHFERAVSQRLGYLLDRLGREETAAALHEGISLRPTLPWIGLEPQRRTGDGTTKLPVEINERWRVVIHREPEIDE